MCFVVVTYLIVLECWSRCRWIRLKQEGGQWRSWLYSWERWCLLTLIPTSFETTQCPKSCCKRTNSKKCQWPTIQHQASSSSSPNTQVLYPEPFNGCHPDRCEGSLFVCWCVFTSWYKRSKCTNWPLQLCTMHHHIILEMSNYRAFVRRWVVSTDAAVIY